MCVELIGLVNLQYAVVLLYIYISCETKYVLLCIKKKGRTFILEWP